MVAAWYDVSHRGRRLEAISRHSNTSYWRCIRENNDKLAQSYFDRLMKVEFAIKPYIAEFTGVEKLLKDGNARIKEVQPILLSK